MQFPDDTALADAIERAIRNISVRVLFDWNRDGTFSHEYSDLSAVVAEISVSRSIAGDLPTEVTIVQGHSAAEMSMKLEGSRDSSEPQVQFLFGAFQNGSPLYGVRKTGTPVIYDIIINTDEGERAIRQFTGTVREALPKRAAGLVDITCENNARLVESRVTLPRWASQGSVETADLGELGNFSPGGPMNSVWAMNYALRAADYYQGPKWTDSAVLGWSFCGGALPDLGHTRVANYVGDPGGVNRWQYDTWGYGPFGPCPDPPNTQQIAIAPRAMTNRGFYSRTSGHGPSPQNFNYVSLSGWVKFTAGGSTAPEDTSLFLMYMGDKEPMEKALGVNKALLPHFDVQITPGGQIDMFAFGYNMSRSNYWGWTTSPNRVADGWHYIHASFVVTLAGAGIDFLDAELFVDGEDWTFTKLTNVIHQGTYPVVPATGSQRPTDQNGNFSFASIQQPCQYMQWSQTNSFIQLDADRLPQHPPTLPDGRPQVVMDLGLNAQTHIPDKQNVSVWTICYEIANAELGAVFVDEFGQFRFMNHETLRVDQGFIAREIAVDDLEDFSSREIADSHRNVISCEAEEQHLWRGTVFAADKPDQFMAAASPLVWTYYVPVENTMAIYTGTLPKMPIRFDPMNGPSGANGAYLPSDYYSRTPPANKDSYYSYYEEESIEMGVMITRQNMPLTTLSQLDATNARVFLEPDQRTIRVEFQHSGTSAHGWYFAAIPPGTANDAAGVERRPTKGFLRVGGFYIDKMDIQRGVVTDPDSIDQYGESVLTLEANEWRSFLPTLLNVAEVIKYEVSTPVPVADDVPMVGDPRTQVLDVVGVADPEGSGPRVLAQITGINRDFTKSGGLTDKIRLRILLNSGVGLWDDPELGLWDQTFTWS